jgi:hypothetical protein
VHLRFAGARRAPGLDHVKWRDRLRGARRAHRMRDDVTFQPPQRVRAGGALVVAPPEQRRVCVDVVEGLLEHRQRLILGARAADVLLPTVRRRPGGLHRVHRVFNVHVPQLNWVDKRALWRQQEQQATRLARAHAQDGRMVPGDRISGAPRLAQAVDEQQHLPTAPRKPLPMRHQQVKYVTIRAV